MEMDSNAVLEASNGGPSSSANGSISSGHGWQKVTNPKKLRRQEKAKPGGGNALSIDEKGNPNGDWKVFQSLEKEAEDRRARRDARAASILNSEAHTSITANDGSDTERENHVHPNGVHNEDAKKTKPVKLKKPKISVAEAAAAIDASHLTHFLLEIAELYRSLPDVQLMRCTDYFGRAFSSVGTAQFAWNKINKGPLSRVVEEPLCHLPEAVVKTVSEWLAERPAEAFPNFITWALTDVMEDGESHQGSQKGVKSLTSPSPGKTKVAVLLVLALVFRKRPETLLQQAAKIRSTSEFQGQEKLATLVWAYSQAAQGDLVIGMCLWVQNLLPLAVGKLSTPVSRDFTLQFVESIILGNMKKTRPILFNAVSRKGERLVPPLALESVMRLAFPIESAKTKATERFLAIYPIVKELALAGSHRSKSTKPVAQQLLPFCLLAASEDVLNLRLEVCNIFRWCLSQNPDCYKQWEKLHLENLKGSTHVLEYLCLDWKESHAQLVPLNDIKRTMSALRAKHRSSLEHAKRDPEFEALLHRADNSCKALEKKLARVVIYVKAIAMIFCTLAIAYGCYLFIQI
ncbi:hypothetical protein O6H91_15G033400 [Diphasiastrum complanatum]|uniref:Uncharacterized protein n=1 Tax=Diphasiastrum complanatum TaxID=34168 RepID=A0ACC2BH15_DIPCM|nr:hypothetical protein O6H91_15G033400 [Diphasiastrum complanatum]